MLLISCAAAAEEKDESPADCKKRIGSERRCFQYNANFHETLCGMMLTNAKINFQLGKPDAFAEYEKCGPDAKVSLRPFYDALLVAVDGKPLAIIAAKKSMSAFIAIMKLPPGSLVLQNNLTTALAELEIEAP